jgi:hypothetical protein
VALIPAGAQVSSAGEANNVNVTANSWPSNSIPITLFDRVLGVGGKNGETNFDQFVLQTNQVTDVINVLPGAVDGGRSSGVAISADGATAAEADVATSFAQAASERVVSFNAQPSVAPLTINVQPVNVYGQDIAVSGDGQVALIAAFIPDAQSVPVPALVRVTALDSPSPVSAELPMPAASECVHEVALSADGNTAAVITSAIVVGC